MDAFRYPTQLHQRKHGPKGYSTYESYRAWLRDEFSFRCIYCLAREAWIKRAAVFEIDHLIPVSKDPLLANDYDNLVYACANCNSLKGDAQGFDPSKFSYGDSLMVSDDGIATALTPQGEKLILQLRLNHPDSVRFRRSMIKLLALAEKHDPQLFAELMAYPKELPDLRSLRPPDGNSRPAGIENSAFERRKREELEETYH